MTPSVPYICTQHSWSGNLVTNHTWEHFWLNEGFTVMLERKILGRLRGEPTFQFHAAQVRRGCMRARTHAFDCYGRITVLLPQPPLLPSLYIVRP